MADTTAIPGTIATATAVHHVGMSVASIDEALAFWERFLGAPALWRELLNRPYLAKIIGIPGVSIKGAFVELPGGVILELLDYEAAGKARQPGVDGKSGQHPSLPGCRRRRALGGRTPSIAAQSR